ncbi:MAG: hypothetical protein LKJ86_05735 [Oscillibacter sp.]|nr:hypothetical protein [Oscillibacter sp.]
MSREVAAGRYGVVGSEGYFRSLNQEYWIGSLMDSGRETEYYDCLRNLADNIRSIVDEIYEDLKQQIGIIRYLPREHRESMTKVLLGLHDICQITSSSDGRCDSCISILSLSDDDTRPKSGASDSEIEDAAKLVRDSSFMNQSDRMDTVRKAMDWGESSASGNLERTLFLRALMNGKGREFLGDVWLRLLYGDDERQFTGRCGRVICSAEYIDHMEQHIFGRDIPNYYGGRNGDRAYGKLVTNSLESIVRQIRRDLEQGERDNDYIRDENAERLKSTVKDLERCGVRCYSLEVNVDKLAWFVGGDPDKIRELQQKLNELGISDRLTEDGVYGKKTNASVEKLMDALRGSVPTLAWIDPLQSSHTKIYSIPIESNGLRYSSLRDLSPRSINPKGTTIFRADAPHSGADFYHINTVEGKSIKSGKYTASEWQLNNLNGLNHTEISEDAYTVLKNFDGVAKKIRVAGRVLAATGVVLDALELYQSIEIDKHDADRKIGKTTYSEIASIGGSWAGGALGAKGGALLGASIGTAIFPGVGTAIGGVAGGLILGIVGSFTGDKLGSYVVDITMVE